MQNQSDDPEQPAPSDSNPENEEVSPSIKPDHPVPRVNQVRPCDDLHCPGTSPEDLEIVLANLSAWLVKWMEDNSNDDRVEITAGKVWFRFMLKLLNRKIQTGISYKLVLLRIHSDLVAEDKRKGMRQQYICEGNSMPQSSGNKMHLSTYTDEDLKAQSKQGKIRDQIHGHEVQDPAKLAEAKELLKIRKALVGKLIRCVDELNSKERSVLTAYGWLERYKLPGEKAAKALNTTVGTASSKLSRVHEKLRNIMKTKQSPKNMIK